MTQTARDRRWAERRANRLNARRLAALPLFEHTPALELVSPTVTTDAVMEWERNRVEATNRQEAQQERYWMARLEVLRDRAQFELDPAEFAAHDGYLRHLFPIRSYHTLAYHCDHYNNLLAALGTPGYVETRTDRAIGHAQQARARQLDTWHRFILPRLLGAATGG